MSLSINMLYVFAFMIILFLFMTKLKREREAHIKRVINKPEGCAFPFDKSNTNWSLEEYVDPSYKMDTFIDIE